METISRVRAALLACVALSACSANRHAIHFTETLSGNDATVMTIDAKQRVIESSPFGRETTVTQSSTDGSPSKVTTTREIGRRYCSEPSPDVFSVMAQSLSVGGTFSQGANPASIAAAFNGAFSSSEQGSTIPKTQTINMLRELMFRTCERYVSGGYDAKEMSIQAIRDQRLMVSILAIEQLAGVVTPKPVVIGAAGGATSGAGSDAIVRLDDARKAKESAETTFVGSSDAYNTLNGDTKVCDTLKGKKEADVTDDALKPKVKLCDDARAKRDAAQGDLDAKTAAYLELANLARTSGISALTTVSSTAPGGLDSAHPEAVQDVATTVRAIVDANFSDGSEVLMFCLKYLTDPATAAAFSSAQQPNLQQMCIQYLGDKVQTESARLVAESARLGVEIKRAEEDTDTLTQTKFETFWTDARATSFSTTANRSNFATWLGRRLTKANKPKARCFASAADRAAIARCFGALSLTEQDRALTYP